MATESVTQQQYVTERSDRAADDLRTVKKLLRKFLENENNLLNVDEWKYEKSSKLSEFSEKPKARSLLLYYLTELLASTTAAISITSSNRKLSGDSEIRVLHVFSQDQQASSTADNDDGELKAKGDNGYPPSSHTGLRTGRYDKTLGESVNFTDNGKCNEKFNNGHPPTNHDSSQKGSYETTSGKSFDSTDEGNVRKLKASLCNNLLSTQISDLAKQLLGVDDNSTKLIDRPGVIDFMDKCKSIICTDMEHRGVSKRLVQLTPLFNCTELDNVMYGRLHYVYVVTQGEMSLENFMRNLTLLPPHAQRNVMQIPALRYRSFECLSQEWRRRYNIDNGNSISNVVSLGFYFLGSADEIHCCFCGHNTRLSENLRRWQHQCTASQTRDGAAVLQRAASGNGFAVATCNDSGSSSTETTCGAAPVEAVDYESPPGSPTPEVAPFYQDLPADSRGQPDGARSGHASSSSLSALQPRDSTPTLLDSEPPFLDARNRDHITPTLENVDPQNLGNRVVQELVGVANRLTIVEHDNPGAAQCQDGLNYERPGGEEG